MKHTPSEWPIDRHCGRIESIGPLYAAADAADDTDLHAWLEVTDADANLIAAAPDLLEALQECVTDDNANCIVTNDVAYMIRRFRAINAIARDAIAKATGVQQ